MAFITQGRFSNKFGRSLGEDKDFEMVYELGHRIQLTPAFFIQPSIQYIQDPGGTGDIDDAVVIGAWVGASFEDRHRSTETRQLLLPESM